MVSPFVVLKPRRQYLKSRAGHFGQETVVSRKVAIGRAIAGQILLLWVEHRAQFRRPRFTAHAADDAHTARCEHAADGGKGRSPPWTENAVEAVPVDDHVDALIRELAEAVCHIGQLKLAAQLSARELVAGPREGRLGEIHASDLIASRREQRRDRAISTTELEESRARRRESRVQ